MSNSESELDHARLEILAKNIKPAKTKSKKGKKFADTQFMLALVEDVNKKQEEKIQTLLENETELLKRLVRKEKSRQMRKETRKDKVAKMKEKLKNKGKNAREERAPKNKGGRQRDLDNDPTGRNKMVKEIKPKKRVQFK